MALELTRRGFFGLGAGAATLALTKPALAAGPSRRALKFHNTHTGEVFSATYWADGAYVPDALAGIKKVLRDHRNGAEHDIDTRLLDLLVVLRGKLDTSSHFEVISGYRSPESNAKMHKASGGVAKHSLHMQGQAIDIRVPGRDLAVVQKAALVLKGGGVGYYPASDFVHVDCGRVRHWQQGRDA